MEVATQLSLFLANQPGTLAAVCDFLSEHDINIYAFTTSDSVDHTVVRMVVDQPRQAMLVLERRGALVVETEVLMLEGDNKPGSLARIAQLLAEEGANIEYAYCATPPQSKRGLLILRPDDIALAMRAINRKPAAKKKTVAAKGKAAKKTARKR
ncbi:MAG: ACT domain-containing protein [Verrucomicrobiota bacterium]